MEYIVTSICLSLVQGFVLLLIAPLVAGIINKVKARLQKRQGASIFQEYFDICKWWKKATILTPYTGVIFVLAPVVYFMTSLWQPPWFQAF